MKNYGISNLLFKFKELYKNIHLKAEYNVLTNINFSVTYYTFFNIE